TAAASLAAPNELQIVQGAGHLFEEPGALEEVSSLAAKWFGRYLKPIAREQVTHEGTESNARG
ncbi:MAG TPA: hypothetical protein VLA34_03700, partial [Candidatus Krumholzibacterium sp.]|nr:hypothetical protein [Candidatus Krumholzibacterium sp.]